MNKSPQKTLNDKEKEELFELVGEYIMKINNDAISEFENDKKKEE